jgi:hypothetical protein
MQNHAFRLPGPRGLDTAAGTEHCGLIFRLDDAPLDRIDEYGKTIQTVRVDAIERGLGKQAGAEVRPVGAEPVSQQDAL